MNSPAIEILESRIAPASIYLASGTKLFVQTVVVKGASGNAQNTPAENAAQAAVGSDSAFLMSTGDRLYFDTNGDGRIEVGEPLLLTVTAGQAMVFLTDFSNANHFLPGDISGLSVSDGFRGTAATDLHGSIVTALDAQGNLTLSGAN